MSAKHLLLVACAWSVFTIAAVFTSWLAPLQLITIWATYGLLRGILADRPVPDEDAAMMVAEPQGGAISIQQRSPTFVRSPAQQEVGNRGVGSSRAAGLQAGLNRINDRVRQKVEVELATSDLRLSLSCERTAIEAALRAARSRREIERKGPDYVRRYNEAHARLSGVLQDFEQGLAPTPIIQAPDFDAACTSQDPLVAKLGQERISELRKARKIFLDECLDELARDPIMKMLFWKKILDQEQPQLAQALTEYAAGPVGK